MGIRHVSNDCFQANELGWVVLPEGGAIGCVDCNYIEVAPTGNKLQGKKQIPCAPTRKSGILHNILNDAGQSREFIIWRLRLKTAGEDRHFDICQVAVSPLCSGPADQQSARAGSWSLPAVGEYPLLFVPTPLIGPPPAYWQRLKHTGSINATVPELHLKTFSFPEASLQHLQSSSTHTIISSCSIHS